MLFDGLLQDSCKKGHLALNLDGCKQPLRHPLGGGGGVVVGAEIIALYLVQMGRFLAATGYVAPSPNHVQYNVPRVRMYLKL